METRKESAEAEQSRLAESRLRVRVSRLSRNLDVKQNYSATVKLSEAPKREFSSTCLNTALSQKGEQKVLTQHNPPPPLL